MADVAIDFNCGCGYKTKRLEEAIQHSETTHHTLTVLGTIKTPRVEVKPDEGSWVPKPRVAKSSYSDIEATKLGEIEALRLKLNLDK